MLIAVGAVFATMGITYNDVDVAMYAGIAILGVGVVQFVIQSRMAKSLKA